MARIYQKKNRKYIKLIIEELKQTSQDSETSFSELVVFVQNLYEFLSAEDFNTYGSKNLCAAAISGFSFIKRRLEGKPLVRIYNPSIHEDGWECENTIIEIVNEDMPFLVDSLTEEIVRHNLKIYQLVHPVMEIIRDEKGFLKKISEVQGSQVDKNIESVLHIKVSHITDRSVMKELENKIQTVLTSVRHAVNDWKEIVKKTNLVVTEFSATVEMLLQGQSAKEKKRIKNEASEIREFLEWLKYSNFVFLGYIEYEISTKDNYSLRIAKGSRLGIFKMGDPEIEPINKSTFDTKKAKFNDDSTFIEITKANKKSIVHRPVHMDYISIKRYDLDGNFIGEHRFIGTFTSVVYHQSAKSIPLIRKKIENIKKRSGFLSAGHSAKALVAILDDFPRDELFQISEDDLFEAAMGIVTLGVRPRVRLFVRKDDLERFISCIIFVPRDRMSTEVRKKMESILTDAFDGKVSNHYTQITEPHLARLQIIVRTSPGNIPPYNVVEIEEELAFTARIWEDSLHEELYNQLGNKDGEKTFEIYKSAFSPSYKNRFTGRDAYYDIKQITPVIGMNKIGFDIYPSSSQNNKLDQEIYHFKIYSPKEQISLAMIMPLLENMGLYTIDEHTYQVIPESSETLVWIHHFRFSIPGVNVADHIEIKRNFEEAIEKIWNKEIQNDKLNKLILGAGLKWRQVELIRAYSKYLQLVGFTYSHAYILEALCNHPNATKLMQTLFYIRFDPLFKGNRSKRSSNVLSKIEHILSCVSNLAEDRVLRVVVELILATTRTNYFQSKGAYGVKEYISIKFDSSKIPFLPKPCPYAEIFVFSARVEGVHLRGGKVARGGLRWSDRTEDFRTEVLGLMKAQMTKNSVIIPVGSKGGFVVKQPPKGGGREEFLDEGVECYKTFLRGMLDITDNMISGKVDFPKDVICYDDEDPYLVVAADKGTASFSDIANTIALEYGFWLGDAFASGGSAGYDHKKMGITAKGAWLSVQRHFSEIGINVQKQQLTVVGIGDMSGDVFGNGMLSSKKIKLVAAFNHLHIFVDPNPDATSSYNERKRLFRLSRSNWADYNKSLISEGGDIFERSAKTITLSRQIKKLLKIRASNVTPDELIKSILLAPVDLLWNGGIGTYVKSRTENNDNVDDKANDSVRINGEDLKAKVVGEGGNLGFTQLGRIEYALNGGRINNDSIDNSAGVDCSDHEVNIKIALGKAIENGKLDKEDRDNLLQSMTNDVSELVLRDNLLQTQALTIAELRSHEMLATQARLIAKLEKEGHLDRAIEFLPDEEHIAIRHTNGAGLMRPELAVILAYSKITLYQQLLKTNLPEDEYYQKDLVLYFPKSMHRKYHQEITSHPLRREIIATAVANSIVNRLGTALFYHLQEDTGMNIDDIAKAYTIVKEIFDLREFWQQIESLNGCIDVKTQVELFVEIKNLMERASIWFLRNQDLPLRVAFNVELFQSGIRKLFGCLTNILPAVSKKAFDRKLSQFIDKGVPEALAKKVAALESMSSACDIIEVVSQSRFKEEFVSAIYFEVGVRLQISWLRNILNRTVHHSHSYWEKTSLNTLIDDLFDEQKRLTLEVIKLAKKGYDVKSLLDSWVRENCKQIQRYDAFINDLKSLDEAELPMVIVAIRKVKEICSI